MAIKTGATGPYLVQPEEGTGVELDSRFFTPNTLIGSRPVTVTFYAGTNGNNWQTTVDRIRAGDPRAPITAMATPSGAGSQFSYEFDADTPNGTSSTFYGDQLRIKTTYCGSVTHPVAPQLNTSFGNGDTSVSGLSLIHTLDIIDSVPHTLFGPSIVSANTITVNISGTGQGSCGLNYSKNNTRKREQAIDNSVFYADPGSSYQLEVITSETSYGEYSYPIPVDNIPYAGTLYRSGSINIAIRPNVSPGPTPTPQS